MEENLNQTNSAVEISDYDKISFENSNLAKREKKILKIISIFIAIIILLGIGVFLFFYFKNKEKEEDKKKEIICGPGYFHPTDDKTEKLCLECTIKNCEKCTGTILNNICKSCYSYFFPVYEKNKIKICEPICQEGEEDKCLTCDQKTNNCSSCNPFYNLTNGICEPNFSIKATYFVSEEGKSLQLINPSYIEYMIEAIINGQIITPIAYYRFSSKGNNTVYFLMNMSSLDSAEKMFYQNKNITSIYFSSKFKSDKIKKLDYIFAGCSSLTSIDFTHFNIQNATSYSYMFHTCNSLASINLSNLNTINVENMEGMFFQCYKLNSINISSFNTHNLRNMANMFQSCTSLTSIDLSNFSTNNVEKMENLFYFCSSLISIDLSNFNSEKVKSLENMFNGCKNLENIHILSFNIKNIISMHSMFKSCSSLTSLDF